MDVIEKIERLRIERGWSVNRLAYEAALTQSTVANVLNNKAEPRISTLKAICDAFGMTLSEFFYENANTELSPKALDMLISYNNLSEIEQRAVFDLIKAIEKTKKR